ncbi:MAG: bifunctional phosphopantothenoylcysteine decarboxylase/phosphopantothenate--cysteine ligase CoaBC [Alphaproteobacteria bacterium]|nr:bifunctional phosphopantothenoylcysteine decarboxylase/phosphopantothenate--cysteine ligase CoaBC [Alphaproteobacteria bacterium]
MQNANSTRHRVLLILSGGIAAYKCLDLIRRLKKRGLDVRCVLTQAAQEFVTPLSVAALSEDKVYSDLFSLTDESEMGHIELSRQADLVVVAPASADILARMAAGVANDLATTVLLATDKPVMAAPAMNVRMWEHPATQANIALLHQRGVTLIGPVEGDMACGEYGYGRMAEPEAIETAILAHLKLDTISEQALESLALAGKSVLVTSGPTHEPIDPVRYIANRSSGRQGHAIAAALAAAGARVRLVTGPVALPDPLGVETTHIESAREMLAACENNLPVDVAICAAAVADWRVAEAGDQKIKKTSGALPSLSLAENPDILATLSKHPDRRPELVIGFAAETEAVVAQASEKRLRKGCDWIVANDVSAEAGVFGGGENQVHIIDETGAEAWPRLSKYDVAEKLTARITAHFAPEIKLTNP